jgi:hypothetical protein
VGLERLLLSAENVAFWRCLLPASRRRRHGTRMRVARAAAIVLLVMLGACSTQPRAPDMSARRPADIRAEIVRLLPASVKSRDAWATDITAAFAALHVDATTANLCATLAVTEQESTFTSDPEVPGLGKIARAEIDRRAKERGIPQLLVRGALALTSSKIVKCTYRFTVFEMSLNT